MQLILRSTDRCPKDFLLDFWVQGPVGIANFFVAAVGMVFLGAIEASVKGWTIWHFFEKAWAGIPLFRTNYPQIKPISGFFLTKQEAAFINVTAGPCVGWAKGL